MKGGDDLLYEEILSYCENDYNLLKKLLDYFYKRMEKEMEKIED